MNPQQFAASALKFLTRSNMVAAERQEFALVESVLQRLGRGELLIGEPEKLKEKKGATK